MGKIKSFMERIFRQQKATGETMVAPTQPAKHLEKFHELEQNRMIEWLRLQSPSIVDAAARELNWDFANDVLVWVLDQRTTDAATAARLFYMGEPSFYVPTKRADGSLIIEKLDDDIIKTFVVNWSKDFYARGNISFKPREEFEHIVKELSEGEAEFRASGMIPWAPLMGIEGPFKGKKSKQLLEYFKTDRETEYRIRALFEDLGTWFDGMDEKNAAYRDWRKTNGFGLTPSWQKE